MGANLVKSGGVWWRRVRPFFYRPLPPYRALDPEAVKCPPLASVGGAQHVVPEGSAANSRMNFLLFENPRGYSPEMLTQGCRRRLRRALSAFTVKPIGDLDSFIEAGHAVYVSFYERTKYAYKCERTNRSHFAAWAATLFELPKVKVLGAYRGTELASVSVSYVVDGVLLTPTFFSRSDALSDFVSELMLHSLRELAVTSDNVNTIFAASADMDRGLDDFYLMRGAQLVSKPALLHVNPLALRSVRVFRKNEYLKFRLERTGNA